MVSTITIGFQCTPMTDIDIYINRSAINGYQEVQIESENNVESWLLHAMIYWLSFHVLRNDIIHPY